VTALIPGPLPRPLYNLQGAFVTDVGGIWGGRDGDFNLWRYNKYGRQVFDDLNVGAGFGIRTILLGYPVRLDWAWRHNGREWTNRRLYFSIGLDF
jgi:outer membrane protein assembly factor BamA